MLPENDIYLLILYEWSIMRNYLELGLAIAAATLFDPNSLLNMFQTFIQIWYQVLLDNSRVQYWTDTSRKFCICFSLIYQ